MVWSPYLFTDDKYSFDLSHEIVTTDVFTALKSSFKHRCKHILRSLRLYGDKALNQYRQFLRLTITMLHEMPKILSLFIRGGGGL